ncbi:MAG: two-component system cell cycle sensor histidine kinase/response regulator CckA, partial [Candidatus Promineifilaceae bacterium]
PITTEEVLGSPEQGLRQLLTRKVPMWNNAGDIVGVLGASLDITERKHLEEQLRLAQKMEAVGQLTAGIAHDFNNMLTVINMSTYLIKQDLSSNDPLEEKVQRISDASKQAANLIAQLMAFSRKQILEPQILSLNVIVKQIEQMLQRTIGEHIEFETSFAPNLWLVKVDPTQIEQMVVNLAVNARDAMPDGGRLSIKLTNTVLGDNYIGQQFQLDPGDYVKLTISDTGIGMSDDIISRIFEPFFTTKEVGRGTGLGLATLYGIVKQNKGDIQVSSKIGVGTTFEIYLPQNESPDLEKPAVLQEKVALKGSETVLLVEDDDGVRELVLDVLQLYGYTVLIAKSGTEALNLFEQHGEHIGILLIDVIMPRMSGKILAQHLSQLRPDVKILYMSGYTDDVIASHGVFEPGVEFLSKPFGPKTLARKIRQVLDRS